MSDPKETVFAGIFDVAPDRQLYGTLTLDGSRTELKVQDKEFFDAGALNGGVVTGELTNLDRVTLVGCLTAPVPGQSRRRDGRISHFASVFPHFVLFGNSYLNPVSESISSVSFFVDDAETIFYDFDAFGLLIDAKEMVEKAVALNSEKYKRSIKTGDDPSLMYFTGKHQIVSFDTDIGLVSVNHAPKIKLGGPNGIGMDNRIRTDVSFGMPISFSTCIKRISLLVNVLGLIAGRPQNLSDVVLVHRIPSGGDDARLRLFWSMPLRREVGNERRQAHPVDVPINAGMNPDEFAAVIMAWVDSYPLLSEARNRFLNCFSKQNFYDVDRLIGAANMFDLLPGAALPEKTPLSVELCEAIGESKKRFKDLPCSDERASVLGYLARVQDTSLKKKVRHRANIILSVTGELFPDLLRATDAAVDARHHYVHGGRITFSAEEVMPFLTDTLEFVFLASDLIECGWDFRTWAKEASISHPLGAYRISYNEAMPGLMEMLSRGKS